jgi:N-acetylneuraminic acid mutarotase
MAAAGVTSWRKVAVPVGSDEASPGPRSGAAGVALGGFLYVFGGYGGEQRLGDFYRLCLARRTWQRLPVGPESPGPRENNGFVACAETNCLYLFGGYDGATWLADLHAFDTHALRWRRCEASGEAPSPRFGFVAEVFQGRLLLFGGYSGQAWLNDMFELDLGTMRWSSIVMTGDVPSKRSCPSWALHGSQIIIFGGHDGLQRKNDLYIYSIADRRWEEVRAPPGDVPGPSLSSPRPRSALSPPLPLARLPLEGPGVADGALPVATASPGALTGATAGASAAVAGAGAASAAPPPQRFPQGAFPPASPHPRAVATADEQVPSAPQRSAPRCSWPSGRYFHASCMHGDQFCVFGGYNGRERLCDLHLFSLKTRQWTQVVGAGEVPSGRSSLVMAEHKHNLFLFGGYNGHSVLDDLFEMPFWAVPVEPPRLSGDLARLLDSPQLCDVTFLVEGVQVHAVRALLAARSEHFRALLFGGMRESKVRRACEMGDADGGAGEQAGLQFLRQQRQRELELDHPAVIELPEVQLDMFRCLLQFLYTDKLTLPIDSRSGHVRHSDTLQPHSGCYDLALRLLVAAERYLLPRLKALCEEALVKELSEDNACDVLLQAHLHNAASLKQISLDYVADNLAILRSSPALEQLQQLEPELFIALLQRAAAQQRLV